MGREYYRSQQEKICGQSVCLETWHETRGWFESNMRHSKITHYASGAIFEETDDDTFHESDRKVKAAATTWISNWIKQQQEAERIRQEEGIRRKEAERQRIEAVRRAEQAAYQRRLRQQQEAQEAEMRRQREEHQRQLRASQIQSLNALKNEKCAERQRISTYELAPVDSEMLRINEKILTEEKELYKFCAERSDPSHKTIVLIGMTGDGKSTFGNRLCGDISMMANTTGPYKTSNNTKSCTQLLQKSIHNKLSIIDCPGWGDTHDNDRTHTNNLCRYLRGCGGINAFVVLRNGANCRFDAYFQKELKYLSSVFGDGFWKHLIVVLTRIDKGFAEFQFEEFNKAQQMKDDVSKLCNGLNDDVAVIPIGLDNYSDKIAQFINVIPRHRFNCDNIKSPIDDLKANREVIIDHQSGIQQRIDAITQEINGIDTQLSNL